MQQPAGLPGGSRQLRRSGHPVQEAVETDEGPPVPGRAGGVVEQR